MKKRIVSLFFALAVMISLASCRYRVTEDMPVPEPEETIADTAEETIPEENTEPEPEEDIEEPEPEPDAPSLEDDTSDRREFDSSASAEVSEDAESYSVAESPEPSETAPVPEGGVEADTTVPTENEESAELTITETVPADEAENLADSDEGETAESAFTYYNALLNSRLGSQFECQKLYVFWETSEDHVTVHKSSPEHEIILLSGAYNASSKLLEDALTVDDGWISRKNPGAIVKVIYDDGFSLNAPAAYEEIVNRTELAGTDAVKRGKVIVLSESLLSTSARRVAAAVYIAKLMYPDELSDIDADEALELLTGEEGNLLSGTYTYTR